MGCSAAFSKGGKYLIVYLNKDSPGRAVVLDAAYAPIPLTGMPEGLVNGVSVAPDDSALAFYASDGSVPDDLYAGAFGATPRRLTNALNPAIRREDLVMPKVVRFKSYDGLEIPGVLYTPHQVSSQQKTPAVVTVHGGPGGQAQVALAACSSPRQPWLCGIRHQQSRQFGLRKDLLSDG